MQFELYADIVSIECSPIRLRLVAWHPIAGIS